MNFEKKSYQIKTEYENKIKNIHLILTHKLWRLHILYYQELLILNNQGLKRRCVLSKTYKNPNPNCRVKTRNTTTYDLFEDLLLCLLEQLLY
jgi:hypothetical protein